MSHLLLYYQRPEPATWVFLSSFLLLGLYFVFHRFFSIRNLDIILLLLLAPGLMMVYEGRRMSLANRGGIEAQDLAQHGSSPRAFSSRPRMVGASDDADLDDATHSVSGAPGRLVLVQTLQPLQTTQPMQPGPPPQNSLSSNTLSSQAAVDANATDMDSLAVGNVSSYQTVLARPRWSGEALEFYGFAALLLTCALLLIRMCIDPALVRRPLLVPNLTIGGLSFIGISLFMFLMANVITSSPREQQVRGPQLGPGYALLNMLPQLPTIPEQQADAWPGEESAKERRFLPNLARLLAVLSNLAIVLGIVGVGYWHFDNVKTGIGCAVMYLLLPYSAQMTGNLEHVMPAAFMVLALLLYRQPLLAGVLTGFAAGLVYYPLFLLPLWISFYWKRGLARLLIGFSASLVSMAGLLLLNGWEAFGAHLRWMFGLWSPRMDGLEGIWGPNGFQPEFRLPILVAFILLSVSFVFWPSRKNLGSLMCGTAAVMLAAQFWHGNGGGLFMAWFLPFTLLTIFRPNLDDRIATEVVAYRAKKLEK